MTFCDDCIEGLRRVALDRFCPACVERWKAIRTHATAVEPFPVVLEQVEA